MKKSEKLLIVCVARANIESGYTRVVYLFELNYVAVTVWTVNIYIERMDQILTNITKSVNKTLKMNKTFKLSTRLLIATLEVLIKVVSLRYYSLWVTFSSGNFAYIM